jgi:hypothetical protein
MSLGRPASLDENFLDSCLKAEDGGTAVMEFLQEGADASAVNKEGETALHLLVRGITCCDCCGIQVWRRELAQALVELDGVDPTRRDKQGRTARDVAENMEFKEFAVELAELHDTYMKELNQPLRFRVNDRIEASVDDGYELGTIVKTRDGKNAYRIRLDSGVEVWAPKDRDGFVRKIGSQVEKDVGGSAELLALPPPPTPTPVGSHQSSGQKGTPLSHTDSDGATTSSSSSWEHHEVNVGGCSFGAIGSFGEGGGVVGGSGDDDDDYAEPPDEATEALIKALESQWLSAADTEPGQPKAERVQLDPKIYSTVATMASSNLQQKQQQHAQSGGGGGGGAAGSLGPIVRRGGKKKKNQKQKKKT